VLVVDVHALRAVDLLHLTHEVELGLGAPAHVEQLARVKGALAESCPGLDPVAVGDVELRAGRERVGVVLALRVGDDNP
jgi:hypothetical protein